MPNRHETKADESLEDLTAVLFKDIAFDHLKEPVGYLPAGSVLALENVVDIRTLSSQIPENAIDVFEVNRQFYTDWRTGQTVPEGYVSEMFMIRNRALGYYRQSGLDIIPGSEQFEYTYHWGAANPTDDYRKGWAKEITKKLLLQNFQPADYPLSAEPGMPEEPAEELSEAEAKKLILDMRLKNG